MNKHRIFSLAAALACIATASLSPAHNASAAPPAPPRDAKKVVYSLKSGSLKTGAEPTQALATVQVKDFDASATFINPSIPRWVSGIIFRRHDNVAMVFFVANDGNAVLMNANGDNMNAIKPATVLTNLKKNANEKNEIAIYARGNQVLAFVNKKHVDTWTVDNVDSGELALFGDSLNDDSAAANGEIKFTNFIVRTPPNAAPGAAVAPPAGEKISKGNIEVVLTNKVGYVPWGRPIGMTEPEKGCNSFNDGSPVQQAQISVQIKNKSNKVMKDFYLYAFKPGGAPAYVCYYNYDGAGNEIQAGQARNLTFAAFVENGESIAYFVVADKELGVSNRVNLP